MIKLLNLNKYYNKGKRNEYHVINDINYEFGDSGLYSFFGPSGCGKTTLLNVIGCLDSFDSGSIIFDEKIINKYVPRNADDIRNNIIGYIFQNYNLVESKNVYENIELILDMIGIRDKDEKNKRISSVLKAVGLYKHRKRSVLALSGGERQRVAIARALAKDPKVILADEPTGNLDSNNTFEIMNIIKKISKDRLVILVSHEKDLVNFYSDYIIELKDGKIVNEIKNSDSSDFNHTDKRNIYLKDYDKKEAALNNINFDVFSNEDFGDLKIDIVYKNGEIYIKPTSSKKIHYLDNSSEVKLLDTSEKEYQEKIKNDESDFSFSNFSSQTTDNKNRRYISLFAGIKNSFKKTGYIKRNRFTSFALMLTGVVFAFLFSALSNILTVSKEDYIDCPQNSVYYQTNIKDQKYGYNSADVINDAEKIDGYVSSGVPTSESNYALKASFNLGRYYQTYYDTFEINYCALKNNDALNIIAGTKISNKYDVLISTWIADLILEDEDAKANSINEYNDIIGLTFYTYYNSDELFTVKGIVEEDSPSIYESNEYYEDSYYYYANSIYIVCENPDLMIEELSKKYNNVSNSSSGAKLRAIMTKVNDNISSLVFLIIVSIALFIYLILLIRSSLFNKIKDIGILRSVGATKKDIMSIFVGDIISITTRKSFIFYSITFLLILYFNVLLDIDYLGIKVFNANIWTYFIGLFFIYFLNIISTIIPVSVLMNKTPVEIIKKYDI